MRSSLEVKHEILVKSMELANSFEELIEKSISDSGSFDDVLSELQANAGILLQNLDPSSSAVPQPAVTGVATDTISLNDSETKRLMDFLKQLLNISGSCANFLTARKDLERPERSSYAEMIYETIASLKKDLIKDLRRVEALRAAKPSSSAPTPTELKNLLYLISPHLHPRVIDSIVQNEKTEQLIVVINKKGSDTFLQAVKKDLVDLVSPDSEGNILLINIPDNNINLFSQNLWLRAQTVSEKNYVVISRDLKKNTSEFDYQVIARKPGGARPGVKLGDAYIKQIKLDNKADLLEFFTYVAFHNFLGTKSPEVGIVRDPDNSTWMISKNLSQSYEKSDAIKVKTFTDIAKLESFQSSFSRDTPIIDSSNIDVKSIGKLMLLSILFQASDLHIENTGLVNSKSKLKLAIVDLLVNEQRQQSDFSSASSWENLLELMINEFEKINCGLATIVPAIPQLLVKLKTEISSFFAAKNAIWHPRSESGSKNKLTLSMVAGQAFFSPRPETFISAVEESFAQTMRLFEQSGFSADEVGSFRAQLLLHKDKIIRNFSVLDAVMTTLPSPQHRTDAGESAQP